MSAVGLDDGAGDGQTQTRPLALPGALVVDPVETLEQPGDALRRDGGARVAHRQARLLVRLLDVNLHHAAGRRVAQGIGEQIGHRATQHEPVAPDPRLPHHTQAHAPLLRQGLVELQQRLRLLGQFHRLRDPGQATLIRLGQEQHVADHA